ncbi:MAG: O-antigen ligase family protein [Acidobacteria bacterium]|nr:O-antigen ligase family protein [Acidobacteriota bacterium]
MSSIVKREAVGKLFHRRPPRVLADAGSGIARARPEKSSTSITATGSFKLAYVGLFLFTFLLYARPQEMFPDLLGNIPLVKLVAIGTLLAYLVTKLTRGERLTIWPLELTMVVVIALLGLAFTPIAASPQDSLKVLLDIFLKVVIIFVLMINLLNRETRLRALLKLSVICGTVLAAFAIVSFLKGNFSTGRVIGIVEGMFGNPNDLALSLDLLLPFAIILALLNRGWQRTLYFLCVAVLTVGVVVTFSRGGFLGLLAAGIVLLWKLSKRNRGLAVLGLIVATSFFVIVMPNGYSSRLTTIFSIDEDPTGSAQARRELLNRGLEVASNHLLIGVGMGNFHIYSIREQVAHNSYLEIASELGLVGLMAYLTLLFAPLRSLRRLERLTRNPQRAALVKGRAAPESHIYFFSVALQAAFVAYLVCSFFGSVEYLWHLYYLVAYSIALRQIYAEKSGVFALSAETEEADSRFVKRPRATGVLWQPAQRARLDGVE